MIPLPRGDRKNWCEVDHHGPGDGHGVGVISVTGHQQRGKTYTPLAVQGAKPRHLQPVRSRTHWWHTFTQFSMPRLR
ncbi:MAG: hypothetical protein KAY02_00600 [Acidovorax sp.]|nr:hypothetical protein [Acidovorax sp.]